MNEHPVCRAAIASRSTRSVSPPRRPCMHTGGGSVSIPPPADASAIRGTAGSPRRRTGPAQTRRRPYEIRTHPAPHAGAPRNRAPSSGNSAAHADAHDRRPFSNSVRVPRSPGARGPSHRGRRGPRSCRKRPNSGAPGRIPSYAPGRKAGHRQGPGSRSASSRRGPVTTVQGDRVAPTPAARPRTPRHARPRAPRPRPVCPAEYGRTLPGPTGPVPLAHGPGRRPRDTLGPVVLATQRVSRRRSHRPGTPLP